MRLLSVICIHRGLDRQGTVTPPVGVGPPGSDINVTWPDNPQRTSRMLLISSAKGSDDGTNEIILKYQTETGLTAISMASPFLLPKLGLDAWTYI